MVTLSPAWLDELRARTVLSAVIAPSVKLIRAGREWKACCPFHNEKTPSFTVNDDKGEVAKWYAEQLNGIAGADARDYLKHRGIDPSTAERFGLGLAPDSRNALKRALAKLGEDKLVETGMLIQPDEGDKASYDRFRGRLMFPVRDARGRVIAFGGRILGDGEPKYLNTP